MGGAITQSFVDGAVVGFLGPEHLQQLLDGLTRGFIYVLLAAGLSVIFGVMHVINFAHGELFALGAFFAISVLGVTSGVLGGGLGFVAALLVAPLIVGVIGVAMERYAVQPLYGRNPLYHILLTFGFVIVINDLIYLVWGTSPQTLPTPDVISGTVPLFGRAFSVYNFFIIVIGSAIAAAVWAILTYTRFGLIIRAGAQDRQMVKNLGIGIDRYYSLIFGLGAALAAVAGVILGSRSGVTPEMGTQIIIPAFVIVVIGGLGSFRGAVVGGLSVGVLQESILRPYAPELEGMVIFLLMIGVLMVRPRGLFGTEFEEGGGELLTGTGGGLLSDGARLKLGVGVLVLLAIVPLLAGSVFSTYYVTLLVRILLWGLFALALDFVMGYTGLVSLGHALFWGLGAYVSAVVLVHSTESALVAVGVALVVGAAVAWAVGFLSVRVHGVYFAMITLAFAELYTNVVTSVDGWLGWELTGGSEGLFGFSAYYGIGGVGIQLDEIALFVGPLSLTGTELFYYIALGSLVVAYLVTRRMLQSPFGSVLKAIRENEERVRFLGYNPTVYKRRAFVVSGIFATLAGSLYVLNSGAVFPEATEWLKSGEVVVMVLLGGMGTLYGPILGAFTFFGLEELLMDHTDRWRLLLGTVFILFVIFLPRGLVSIPEKLAALAPDRGRETEPEPTAEIQTGDGD
ncbi:branched-chain amino acid ABC-type transport system, permease component [Halovivax ruber XH-70]|uniref:Branched-chain amino acid ABC-type transport system, permease component n=1 Tax=Halovivax ruber (strain DSM 18193 / JCM 13892 / XH-70) TaxID=797302 RepID=L0IBS3_HALRX|nr:ABC transporter permease [Halovivax ruber]AGB17015.1 branched-chain amino acid ABC-type transport system, permease component [Halovivax ruber XH-70]